MSTEFFDTDYAISYIATEIAIRKIIIPIHTIRAFANACVVAGMAAESGWHMQTNYALVKLREIYQELDLGRSGPDGKLLT